ncbi:MAG: glycosyltransferase [Alphaproteobacteria bacterium]|nr:glycosyltransferase [Alphaproteobacteria bacterium]
MAPSRSVCVVSPGSLSSNPRLVKEADALHNAGYDVTAVVCSDSNDLGAYDDEIVARVPWRVRRATRSATDRYVSRAARLWARFQSAGGRAVGPSLASAAYGVPSGALRRATVAVRADLYIAHYVAALPAAAAAVRRHGALLGFDAEDFHSGEGGEGPAEAFRMQMVERVEGATVPSCSHVTAAAPLIGQAYAARYGVTPVTILNVFPLAMAPSAPVATSGPPNQLKAYWFSQTIGLDRGLQAFLRAMARARAHVTLDIRGSNRWGHGETLMALARDLGIAARVRILPMVAPDEMVRLAASYDLGLSLETDVSESRRLCLTNKIFTYLLAGVPVMLSDTPAQRALAPELGSAAALVTLGDPDGMAGQLDRLANELAALTVAKAVAWRLGQQRYNWEVEREALVRSVAKAFERRDRGAR